MSAVAPIKGISPTQAEDTVDRARVLSWPRLAHDVPRAFVHLRRVGSEPMHFGRDRALDMHLA
eukprot:4869709-Alexandrium_andersonii.AAC.1